MGSSPQRTAPCGRPYFLFSAYGDTRPTKFKMMSLLNGAWDLFILIFYRYASPDGL